MKKTVFEGVINGQIYNDVQDYNNAMINLLKSGVPIQASTTTKSVDEPESTDSDHNQIVNLYFGFEDNVPVADKFLDIEEDNDGTIDLIEKDMETYLDKVSSAIKRMPISDLNSYLKDVNVIISSLKDADANNDEAIEQLESRLCFLMDSSKLHSVFINYYNNINSMIVDRVSELANNDCKSNCNVNTTIKEKAPQVETDFATAFGKIFGEVFKGVDVNALSKMLNSK